MLEAKFGNCPWSKTSKELNPALANVFSFQNNPKFQLIVNYRKNNYNTIFMVLGGLKSLLSFPLDINFNDIPCYCTNYLLRKCRKKQSRINRTAGARAMQHFMKLQ